MRTITRAQMSPPVGRARPGLLCLVLAVALAGLAALAPRTTLAVTVTDCSDLSALRTTLEGGGTIVIDCGVVTLDFGSELVIDSNTTIDGLGTTTFSGGETHRVIRVVGSGAGVEVTLRGLTLRDGLALGAHPAGSGGGIYVDGADGKHATVQLVDAYLRSHRAEADGGAVYLDGHAGDAALTVTTTNFAANSALRGGAIFSNAEGGQATVITERAIIATSQAANIDGTVAMNGYGGAIYNHGEAGVATVTATNTTIIDNFAVKGGGIYNDAGTGTATLAATHTTVVGNTGGPGVFSTQATGGAATITFTASLLAYPDTGSSHCVIVNAPLPNSGDYNVADDASCNLTQPHDQLVIDAGIVPVTPGNTADARLLPTSPAIDAAACFASVDQRGVVRPQDGDLDGVASCDSGSYELVRTAPQIESLSPESTEVNGPQLQLRICAAPGTVFDFDLETVVLWGDQLLLPTSMTTTCVDVIVDAALLTADEQFVGFITVPVRVRHDGVESNALPFTIIGDGVGQVDSAAASSGGTAVVSTAPITFGGSGLRARLSQGAGSATLVAANYTGNPTGTPLSNASAFLDLQYRVLPPSPIQPESVIAADFYLPPSPIHGVCLPPSPIRLTYWSGAAWLNVLNSGGSAPTVDLTEDLDGTRSCGRISVTFDLTSTPNLAGLGGTVFAIVQESAPVDTTPPTLTLPDDIVVNATSPAGAVVTYTVSAEDDVTATPSVTCAPASGATFAIGVRTVHCTATDQAGNTAEGSFAVHVRGAAEQLAALRAEVQALDMHPVLRGHLLAFLGDAQAALGAAQREAACRALWEFTQRVAAYDAHWLTAAQSAKLRADALRICAVIGC